MDIISNINFENLSENSTFRIRKAKLYDAYIMTTRFIILTLAVLAIWITIFGQIVPQKDPNYDENNVPKFDLPDPLTTFSGKK